MTDVRAKRACISLAIFEEHLLRIGGQVWGAECSSGSLEITEEVSAMPFRVQGSQKSYVTLLCILYTYHTKEGDPLTAALLAQVFCGIFLGILAHTCYIKGL